jgi:hypothetical protein
MAIVAYVDSVRLREPIETAGDDRAVILMFHDEYRVLVGPKAAALLNQVRQAVRKGWNTTLHGCRLQDITKQVGGWSSVVENITISCSWRRSDARLFIAMHNSLASLVRVLCSTVTEPYVRS